MVVVVCVVVSLRVVVAFAVVVLFLVVVSLLSAGLVVDAGAVVYSVVLVLSVTAFVVFCCVSFSAEETVSVVVTGKVISLNTYSVVNAGAVVTSSVI